MLDFESSAPRLRRGRSASGVYPDEVLPTLAGLGRRRDHFGDQVSDCRTGVTLKLHPLGVYDDEPCEVRLEPYPANERDGPASGVYPDEVLPTLAGLGRRRDHFALISPENGRLSKEDSKNSAQLQAKHPPRIL
jgi:hypothetical protein